MKLLPPREKNDCLESKFECRTDTIGLNLAAVSTVVRNAQGSSLAKLSFKADTDRCDCREFFTLNRCGGSVTKLKRRLAAVSPCHCVQFTSATALNLAGPTSNGTLTRAPRFETARF